MRGFTSLYQELHHEGSKGGADPLLNGTICTIIFAPQIFLKKTKE